MVLPSAGGVRAALSMLSMAALSSTRHNSVIRTCHRRLCEPRVSAGSTRPRQSPSSCVQRRGPAYACRTRRAHRARRPARNSAHAARSWSRAEDGRMPDAVGGARCTATSVAAGGGGVLYKIRQSYEVLGARQDAMRSAAAPGATGSLIARTRPAPSGGGACRADSRRYLRHRCRHLRPPQESNRVRHQVRSCSSCAALWRRSNSSLLRGVAR
jgi:hypothetical protein